MIIVTGASGLLGRAIVEHLAQRVPAAQIGVSVRDPAKAADLAALGVRVRQGDFTDAKSLLHAFEGADQVLLVSSNARAHDGDTLAQHRLAIETARTAGATHLAYTSQMASGAASAFAPARDHHATETMLAQSGIAWTALRHGFYASSSFMLLGDFANAPVEAPADGKVAWTAHDDLAAADAAILADIAAGNGARHVGPTPPLTASVALDLADLASIAADLLQRPVPRTIISDDEQRSRLIGRGFPPHAAEIALGDYVAGRAGEFATTDPLLQRLLGRPPTSMRDIMARHLAA
jgi:NAD(P)H dehydrogenase (quinone)